MPREYGEMNPDGTVRTVRENDDGTYSIVNPNQPWWENQGLPDPNANRAQSNAGGNFNWPGLWGSLTGSNQKNFDEMVRQFNAQLEAELRKQASSMAQSLLSGAVGLRGPESWLDYAQYTGGGKDIFKQLYGDIPSPLFGAPTGYSAPITMEDVLKALGLGGAASAGAGQAQQAAPPAAPSQPASTAPGGDTYTGQPVSTAPGPGQQPAQMAPLPHQVNPAVWDSLSGTAKQMLLAAVEKGKTPSGAWSAEDYLTQMNNARPRGNAPQRVGYDFGNYGSYF